MKSIITVSFKLATSSLTSKVAWLFNCLLISVSTSCSVTSTGFFSMWIPLYSPKVTTGGKATVTVHSNSLASIFVTFNFGSAITVNFSSWIVLAYSLLTRAN